MFKLLHNFTLSHASKVMLKILQARLQQYVNCELPDVQPGFRKGRGTRDQLPTSTGTSKKQENSRKKKKIYFIAMLKPLTVCIKTNCGKFLEMGMPDHLTCLLRNLYEGQETTDRTAYGTRLVPNWEKSMPRLYIVTLFI